MILGIDASNIRRGGGITHLQELISSVNPSQFRIEKIVVWGSWQTLEVLPDRSWLKKKKISVFNSGLLSRVFWQKFFLSKLAREEGCDLLLVPGGSFVGNFQPVVAICQNLLPFENYEIYRYGLSLFALKMYLLRAVQSYTFRRVKGVIFLTKHALKTVQNATGNLNGLICIIPHGLNSRFQQQPKDQFPIACYSYDNPFRILYVSIIDHYKHQWHVVEAVAILRKFGLPVILDLVGPAYPPALIKLNKSLNHWDSKNKWAFYHGEIPFNLLHNYYAKADLGLFASSCENLPNILLETMASGLPIACSDRGPMSEILGVGGIYFNPEKPKDIARALKELIESPALRLQLAQISYKISGEYSWARCADETLAFLIKCSNKSNK